MAAELLTAETALAHAIDFQVVAINEMPDNKLAARLIDAQIAVMEYLCEEECYMCGSTLWKFELTFNEYNKVFIHRTLETPPEQWCKAQIAQKAVAQLREERKKLEAA